MNHQKLIVAAGATGALGSLIAEALLDKPEVRLRVLGRPGSGAKAAALADRGAEVVEAALDGSDDEALRVAVEGAYTVVSVIRGGPDVIIDAQTRLLEAALAAGAKRFIPSDFSYNIFGLDEGENINTDWRREFARRAEKLRADVQIVRVSNGCFLDRRVLFGFLGAIDLETRQAFLWGDGAAKMDFTTYRDTALFTAEAAVDSASPSEFNIAGDRLDFHELAAAYEAGSGENLTVVRKGSLADLDAEIARLREATPDDVMAWLPLMYWRAMLNGKAKLGPLVNDRYPGIRPTTVREYVEREGL